MSNSKNLSGCATLKSNIIKLFGVNPTHEKSVSGTSSGPALDAANLNPINYLTGGLYVGSE